MKKSTVLSFVLALLAGAFVSCQHLELPSHGEPKPEEGKSVSGEDIAVQMVKINKDSLTVINEYSAPLRAGIYPYDTAKVKEIIWSSLDERIVSVNDTGLVTGLSTGEGRIVAAYGQELADTCIVTVLKNIHVESVSLDMTEADLYLGSELQLVATVAPEDARIRDIVWSSDNEEIATVDQKGKVTPVKEGVVNISATSVEGSKTGSCKVTVKRVAVTGITLSKTTLSIAPGSTATLKATVAPADATYPEVTWKSSDANVAEVDANGRITGRSLGTATITATTVDGEFTADCAVTVEESTGTTTLTLTFDLSSCPASLASVQSKIPNGTYAFVDKNGDSYDFTIKKASSASSAVASYSSKGYLVINVSDYLGTPVIKNGKLKSFTFVQGAASNGKRKSAMTSETHEDALKAEYYDCADETMGTSIMTDTQNEAYTFTILDPQVEKSYYFVCAQSGIGLKSIQLTYEVEAPKQPINLHFDFTGPALPGWPTTDNRTPHVEGGTYCIYPLNGVDYEFVCADCGGASKDRVCWRPNQDLALLALHRYFGLPAISGYKLTKVVAHHNTSANANRKTGICNEIESGAFYPDDEGGHGYVTGGMPQSLSETDKDYTWELEGTVAGKRYYMYQMSSGAGFSYIELSYDPE